MLVFVNNPHKWLILLDPSPLCSVKGKVWCYCLVQPVSSLVYALVLVEHILQWLPERRLGSKMKTLHSDNIYFYCFLR